MSYLFCNVQSAFGIPSHVLSFQTLQLPSLEVYLVLVHIFYVSICSASPLASGICELELEETFQWPCLILNHVNCESVLPDFFPSLWVVFSCSVLSCTLKVGRVSPKDTHTLTPGIVPQRISECPRAAPTKHHRQKPPVSQSWRLEVRKQRPAAALPCWRFWGRAPPRCSAGCLWCRALLGLQAQHSHLCLGLHMAFSPLCPAQLCLRIRRSYWIRLTLIYYNLISLTTSAKTSFPNKVMSWHSRGTQIWGKHYSPNIHGKKGCCRYNEG